MVKQLNDHAFHKAYMIKPMFNRSLIILCLCLLSGPLFGQGFMVVDTTSYVEWKAERPLNWADFVFRDIRRGDQQSYALTSVIHSVRGDIKDGKPNFEVRVLFVKKDSWTTSSGNRALLAHEQLHFDLAELYGRKIRKQFVAMGAQGIETLGDYKKSVKVLLNEFKRKSVSYDKETKHGRIEEEQKEWERYVKAELERLNEYKYINTYKYK
jgi:hypothetical protein